MNKLTNKELMEIEGGASYFTASFFNAISRTLSTIMSVGKSLGSSIRRMFSGSYCSI